jgi:hypothetical protein
MKFTFLKPIETKRRVFTGLELSLKEAPTGIYVAKDMKSKIVVVKDSKGFLTMFDTEINSIRPFNVNSWSSDVFVLMENATEMKINIKF